MLQQMGLISLKAEFVAQFKSKVQNVDLSHEFCVLYYILHQEAFCAKILGMDHMVNVVVKTVNLI